MKLEVVPLSSVSFGSSSLFIGQEGDIYLLKNSIKRVGIINPPILRREDEAY